MEDGDNLKNGTEKGLYDKSTLTNKVLSDFGSDFKSDYEESINEGFPILSWQPSKTAIPNTEKSN